MHTVEFSETFTPDGIIKVSVKSPALPKGLFYSIVIRPDGVVRAKSCSNGRGTSVRYYLHHTYTEAQEHALAWVNRKINEQRRKGQA